MKRFLCFFVVLFFSGKIAFAEDVIKDIQVKGNQRVESSTVISYINFKQGDVFDQEVIDAGLKKLFSTGMFANISIENDNGNIIINVSENPIINEVDFEGNKRIDDKTIKTELRLGPRSVYTRAKLQSDVKRIQDIYRQNGRFAVVVEPKVIQLESNRLNIVYEIEEGDKTTVKKINFVGNNNFSDRSLSKVINTQESRWYKFFSSGDTYDPDKLAYDKELLRKYYVSKGYADFKVKSAIAEITRDNKSFVITFTLEEGEEYNFGSVKIKSRLKDIDANEFQELVETIPDERFNADLVDSSVDAITEKLNDLGYAFVDIRTIYDRDEKNRLMGLVYDIREGPKVYVNRININGNVRTLDKVIRRELRMAEGDPFNASKIRRSQQRIRNLGFFENVDVKQNKTAESDKVDLDVNVTEQSTGELNFGAGFSTVDGALASVGVRERNLLGRGQDLRFNVQKAARATNIVLGFTEPYFLDKDISAGIDVYSNARDRERESSFDQETLGLTLRTSYALTEHLRHLQRYSYREEKITDVASDASTFIRQQEGGRIVSSVGQSFVWDHLDNRRDPTDGYYVRLDQDIAGLGGDSKYIEHEGKVSYYHPIYKDKVVYNAGLKGGYIFAYSGNVRIDERYYLGGGNSMLGFNVGGVGPRDSETTDSLGGNLFYVLTNEVRFPLGLPEELGVRGAAYVQAGSLTGVDEQGENVLDSGSIRMSGGFGVSWASPFGPVRVNLTKAFVSEDYDKEKVFDINFGTGF